MLHSILVGLTLIFYIRQWGLLLQVRSYALYVAVPILWSSIFIYLLLETQLSMLDITQPFTIGSSFIFIGNVAIYYWIGMLLFPPVEQLDKQNKFAYFDYYEHFRKQHQWIIGLAIIAFGLRMVLFSSSFMQDFNYLILACLIWAFFVEHKGLMCLLTWSIISLFLLL